MKREKIEYTVLQGTLACVLSLPKFEIQTHIYSTYSESEL